MPLYAKLMKELISKKRNWRENETVVLTKECSAIIQKNLPEKLKDSGSFVIACTIGDVTVERALCDLGARINLMPLSLMCKLQIEEVKPTQISLQLDDRSLKLPLGVVENLLVKVKTFIFPADFLILDMEEDVNASIILGRPFLATGRALIDVQKGELILRVNDEHIVLNVFKALQHPNDYTYCMKIDIINPLVQETLEEEELNESLKSSVKVEVGEIEERAPPKEVSYIPSTDEGPLKLELKPLPPSLKYAFLGESEAYPVIINSSLNTCEEALIKVLKEHKTAIGWTIGDLKGISPTMYIHKILLEEDVKPIVQAQRSLNPTMKEVV
ncbi:uncharacterized protein LOC107640684 [Arachis ipaensis]|uniref:uncharacterized protein LOC107640684 n=1 Tax=Arachis ipaensis TaxID=130454 RepID=UPI0007AF62E8|nr:uncharacterized protein LOC107640684 [Arachis ipaensis]XP_025652375.1 uncharacterized protein LOC112748361 [Arachis hypogaea]